MKSYLTQSLKSYLDQLSAHSPVPGGGSAAALAAALGTALISMAAQYALKRNLPRAVEKSIQRVLKNSERIRSKLQTLVDKDAQAYLRVVVTRKASQSDRKAALRQAGKVPLEVARLCYEALDLIPPLVEKGSPFLLSDLGVAGEFLFAAFKAAMINVRVNQE
ncbi:MAG: cyclodeaminase/cyclohydrolase family protein [Candidatus Omnitrophota bacterium]